jgi:flagellar basal body-associated protein FliL
MTTPADQNQTAQAGNPQRKKSLTVIGGVVVIAAVAWGVHY